MDLKYLTPEEAAKSQNDGLFPLFKGFKVKSNHRYLVAVNDSQAIGFVELYSPLQAQNLHIETIEVAERNQGIATAMLGEVFAQAKKSGLTITNNGFTPLGQKYLVHLMNRMGEKSGVAVDSIGRC